jgi:putative chitinase
MIVKALSQIDTHPLHAWAKAIYHEKSKQIEALTTANQNQADAVTGSLTSADAEVADIEAQIAAGTARYDSLMQSGDLDKAQQTHKDRMILVKRLAEIRGSIGKQQFAAGVSTSTISIQADTGQFQATFASKLTVKAIKKAFPARTKAAAIEKYLPFIVAAINEFQLYEPKLVAAVFATIRAETPSFESVSESKNKFNTQKTPFDLYETGTSIANRLGNSAPGDGAKFRGRGLVQLTGRSNYERMSKRLGLGTLLVDHPDEANDPALSARLLCANISNHVSRMREALDRGDIAAARKMTNGGTHGVEAFVAAYQAMIAIL